MILLKVPCSYITCESAARESQLHHSIPSFPELPKPTNVKAVNIVAAFMTRAELDDSISGVIVPFSVSLRESEFHLFISPVDDSIPLNSDYSFHAKLDGIKPKGTILLSCEDESSI